MTVTFPYGTGLSAASLNAGFAQAEAEVVAQTEDFARGLMAARAAIDVWFADCPGVVGNGVSDDAAALNTWLASLPSPCRVGVGCGQYAIIATDLVLPVGISLIGPWADTSRGEIATTNNYTNVAGSFVVDPARTIRMGHSTGFRGNFVRRRGLVPGTTVAALVANHAGKAGTGLSVGPTVVAYNDTAADAEVVGNIFLGFALGIDCTGQSRVRIRDNKLDCTAGIQVRASYDWGDVTENECWDFLVGSHYPSSSASLFNTKCIIPIATSSVVNVGGVNKRRIFCLATHGFQTGWPVLLTDHHIGAGIAPSLGVSPITVIDPVTFDLETTLGLTTAATGLPSGPGDGAGAGGSAILGVVVNYGAAFACSDTFDWGRFTNDTAWGHAVGVHVDGSNMVSVSGCGIDNFVSSGWWGAIAYLATGASAGITWSDDRACGGQTGWRINTTDAAFGNRHRLVGCNSFGIGGSHLLLEGGSVVVAASDFAMEGGNLTGQNITLGAGAGTLELIGLQSAVPIVNLTGDPNKVRISGGAYGYASIVSGQFATAGTTQGAATPITKAFAFVSVATAGQGVVLTAGVPTKIYNLTATDFLVYPSLGSAMESLAPNAPVVHPAGAVVTYEPLSGTNWWRDGFAIEAGVKYGLAHYAAAGTTQGTATLLTAAFASVDAVTAGQGVRLSPGVATKVFNATATLLKVYPPTGGLFWGQGANASIDLAANAVQTYTPLSSTIWFPG